MASIFKNSKIKERLENFKIDDFEMKIELIKKWRNDYNNGTLKQDKETSREQSFNQDFFVRILGYKQKPETPYTLEPKATTEKGQLPDAILGFFNEENKKIAAVVELKGASIPLDRPQKREGNMSPIQQAFKYKTQYSECPFVLVSNFYEFRLFQDNQLDYEIWTLNDLVDSTNDYYEFRKFYFLLCANNFTSKSGKARTEELLTDIRIEDEEISKKFYKEYHGLRVELLRDLWRNNESIRKDIRFGIIKAQKIIDRIVFVCFCEDKGLLPDNTLHRVLKNSEDNFGSLWNNLKGFFEDIDKGSEKLEIPDGYDGGLFRDDFELNNLRVDDGVLRRISGLGKYNFKEDLSVNILGHIFEQSISDLEEIRKKVNEKNEENIPESIGKRKKDGIYYTPNYIVDYIIQNSLIKYLRDKEDEYKIKHNLKEEIQDFNYEKREKKAYLEYQRFLENIKILDPACGSGAFLVKVFDYLLAENKRVSNILGGGLFANEDYYKEILKNNIYGVDLNDESVEITKLSLWLKTAQKGKKLTDLDNNIKCGNSLIDDERVAGKKAFKWHKEFSDILENGGFDIVIGNPPYVKARDNDDIKGRKFIEENYKSPYKMWDLYIPFVEKGTALTKNGGNFSMIIPDTIGKAEYTLKLIDLIGNNYNLYQIDFFPNVYVFPNVGVKSKIIFIEKTKLNTPAIRISHDPTIDKINKLEEVNLENQYLLRNDDLKLDTNNCVELEDICYVSYGLRLNSDKSDKNKFKKEDLLSITKTGDFKKIYTEGKFLERYSINKELYVEWDTERCPGRLVRPTFAELYPPDKLLLARQKKVGYLSQFGHVCDNTIVMAIPAFELENVDNNSIRKYYQNIGKNRKEIEKNSRNYSLFYLISIINSKLFRYYIKIQSKDKIDFYPDDWKKLPIKRLSFLEQEPLIQRAKGMTEINSKLAEKKKIFINRIKGEHNSIVITKKLNSFYDLEFNEFAKELKKQKVSLSLEKTDEWEKYFNAYVFEIKKLVEDLEKIDYEIDKIVYDLYGISEINIKKMQS
jgi:tRNA1(Val) A37 N6-methylase TrmN6